MDRAIFDGGVPAPPAAIARIALGDMLRRTARRLPDAVALIQDQRRITYAQLDAMANRVANALLARGARPGDRCAAICGNSIELVAAIFAINRAGLIWVPINLLLDAEDVEYTLTHAGVSHVVMEPIFQPAPTLGGVVEKLGLPWLAAADGFAQCDDQPATEPAVDIDRDDIAAIIYTSGTTSKPKGAMHSHQSIYLAAMSNALELSATRDDGIPLQLPLFHCGAHTLLMNMVLVGGRCVLLRGFDPAQMLQAIEEEKLTVVAALPMMYQAMLAHPDWPDRSTASLRVALHTMAPMPEGLMRRLVDEFCPEFVQTSGQTEMYPATTISRPELATQRFGNIWGEAAAVNDMAIMGPDGELLPPGEVGELVHRGPNVMRGYYKNPQATAEARRFGWHHTGDIGRINDFGEFEFLDRTKDMIKSGGENISSMQVEAALLGVPGVAEAVAVGLPHDHWGEAVTAFVVMAPDAPKDPAAIQTALEGHLGNFQRPKRIVFVDEIPKTATGKLRKVELRMEHQDLYQGEHA